MDTSTQQTLFTFGARSGTETFEPWVAGDVLLTQKGVRCLIDQVDENTHGLVFVCTNLATGGTHIVLEREVAARVLKAAVR